MSDEQLPKGSPLSLAMIAACPFPTRQGTQVTIKHLAHALAERGHDVHLDLVHRSLTRQPADLLPGQLSQHPRLLS